MKKKKINWFHVAIVLIVVIFCFWMLWKLGFWNIWRGLDIKGCASGYCPF